MNEESQNQSSAPQEKAPLDDKRKNALLRYITILFAVAFLFVLFSMLLQMRDSQATISQLSQSSASALQNAEHLQDTNRQLQEDNTALQESNAELQTQVDDLTAQVEALQKDLDSKAKENEENQNTIEQLQKELQNAQGKTLEAYEQLFLTMELFESGPQEGNVALSKALETLKSYESYLGEAGLEEYHRLVKEGE